eukprot:1806799-Rhodomonas_salina.3
MHSPYLTGTRTEYKVFFLHGTDCCGLGGRLMHCEGGNLTGGGTLTFDANRACDLVTRRQTRGVTTRDSHT